MTVFRSYQLQKFNAFSRLPKKQFDISKTFYQVTLSNINDGRMRNRKVCRDEKSSK